MRDDSDEFRTYIRKQEDEAFSEMATETEE